MSEFSVTHFNTSIQDVFIRMYCNYVWCYHLWKQCGLRSQIPTEIMRKSLNHKIELLQDDFSQVITFCENSSQFLLSILLSSYKYGTHVFFTHELGKQIRIHIRSELSYSNCLKDCFTFVNLEGSISFGFQYAFCCDFGEMLFNRRIQNRLALCLF